MEWKTGEQTHPDPSADKTQLRHPSLLLRLVPSEDRLDASALPRSNSRTKGVQAAQCETYDLLEELVGEGDEGPRGSKVKEIRERSVLRPTLLNETDEQED